MGSPWTPELRRTRERVISQVFASLEAQGFVGSEADELVAQEVGGSPSSVGKWRNGKGIPTGERWAALERFHAELKSGMKTKKSPKTTAPTHSKQTFHSATVEVVGRLLDTFTRTELVALNLDVASRLMAKEDG